MKTFIRMTGFNHDSLARHLFPGDGCEAAALLVCGRREGNDVTVLTVRRVIPIPYECCSVRTPVCVQWSTETLDDFMAEIWKSSASVIKVHSHPTGFNRFSDLDDASDGELSTSFDCLWEEGRMHASAVLLPNGRIFARTLQHGRIGPFVDAIMVVGDDIDIFRGSESKSGREDDRRNRQAFGEGTISMLKALRVAVIGCSGTGSVVIEQLARLGVGAFVLVDPDHVESKNLNRIVNATAKDAEFEVPKVEVMRRMIQSLGRGQEVIPLKTNLDDPDAVRRVAECDAIFGCVDGAEGRNLANRIAAYYVQPYIDVGVSLAADGVGGISTVAGAVNYYAPGHQSLIERGAITQEQISAEELNRTNPERYEQLKRQKYIQGVDENRPAVISVNMFFAALAVNEFLARIHRFRNMSNGECGIIRGDLCESALFREPGQGSTGHLFKEIGLGDQLPLLGRSSLSERQ